MACNTRTPAALAHGRRDPIGIGMVDADFDGFGDGIDDHPPPRPRSARFLTGAQQEAICRLRETEGLSVRAIAKRLGVSPGGVAYHCLKTGAERPDDAALRPVPYVPQTVQRRGRPVRQFTPEQDALIEALAAEGVRRSAIGRRFDPPRAANCITVRLMTLARLREREQDERDAAAALPARRRA